MEFYGTLGPSCADVDTLEQMFRHGMTGMRLNLSHTALRDAAPLLEAFHRAADRAGTAPKLLIDMQGPELRIGPLPAPLTAAEGGSLVLGQGGVPVPEEALALMLPGRRVSLDDGKLLLEVTENRDTAARTRVLRGGVLTGRKSLALEGVTVPMPALTAADRANLREASAFGVTGVMQPFVRSREDLETVRAALAEAGCPHVRLLAKIEDRAGAEMLEALLPAANEIVIARGDLGNSNPLWQVPVLQKTIAARCRDAGKPFMVVTQLLASMERSPVPTRAEVSDIFNAVLDGADSLMVTGETAMGRYPAEVIRYLVTTAQTALGYKKEAPPL